jgi:hypothetical protein
MKNNPLAELHTKPPQKIEKNTEKHIEYFVIQKPKEFNQTETTNVPMKTNYEVKHMRKMLLSFTYHHLCRISNSPPRKIY